MIRKQSGDRFSDKIMREVATSPRCSQCHRRFRLLDRARERARDAQARGRRRGDPQARRPRHAVGRSRRRQDHVRARADPPSRRRRHARRAEPDLHAGADLRAAALPGGACRPLSRGADERARRARRRRGRRGRRGAARMAGPRRATRCRPTGSTSRSRSRRISAPTSATRSSPPTAPSRRGSSGSSAIRHFLADGRPRRRDAHAICRATPRRAPTSGSRTRAASLILMNAPRRPDGPPVRGGLPYSAIAHLAEDVKPFVAMARALARARPLGAAGPCRRPQRRAAAARGPRHRRRGRGRSAGADRGTLCGRRRCAGRTASRSRSLGTLPVAPGVDHRLPPYDLDAFLIEAELLLDWYLPHRGVASSNAARSEFDALWREALARAYDAPPTWVLRDYHSPNLLWLPEREGIARVGLLDFQDALMGPAPYDLVSLLQDARVDVPDRAGDRAARPLREGAARRRPDFATTGFVQLYVTLGAQRATKILGIFARLDRRDGKPQYLRHLPRIWRYLRRSLIHPAMNDLKAWYDAHVPRRRNDSETADRWQTAKTAPRSPRHGARRRPRHAHAAADRHAAEAAGARSPARRCIDHVLDRLADAGVETAVVNVHHMADQIESHLKGRTRPKIEISDERGELLDTGGGVVKALKLLGDAAVLPHQFRHDLDRGRDAEPRRGSARSSIPPAWTSCCCSPRPRPASAMRGAAISPWRRTGGCGAAPSARSCRSSMRAPRCSRPRCSPMRRRGSSRSTDVRPRDRGRAAVRPAARRHLDACRHAGGDHGGRSGDFRRAWLSAWRDRCPITAPCLAARLHHSGFGAVPADADPRVEGRHAGRGLSGRPIRSRSPTATLFLPTRRACALARAAFLDALDSRRRRAAAHRAARRHRRGRTASSPTRRTAPRRSSFRTRSAGSNAACCSRAWCCNGPRSCSPRPASRR